mmetsp:Transcript_12807/g.22437  ORF Transcript_12807/g.22437 Transcript_12807/m.22437 type:complete len:203 (+) Transcript_12807:404-1012(+)
MHVPRGPVCCTSTWIEERIFSRSFSPIAAAPPAAPFLSVPVFLSLPRRMPLPPAPASGDPFSSAASILLTRGASCSTCRLIMSLTSLLCGSAPPAPLLPLASAPPRRSSARRVSSPMSSSMSSSSAWPSMMMPSVFLTAGATSLLCSSFAPSFTLGGRRRAVVGRVERLSPPSPSLSSSPPSLFLSSACIMSLFFVLDEEAC